jgi:hypothetical protein
MEEKEYKHYTKTQLKERGWTDRIIRIYMPEPCLKKKNNYYKCAPDICLYEKEKIHKIESLEDFKIEIKKSEKRRNSMKLVAERKRQELIDYVKNLKIEVQKINPNKIFKDACDNYNDWNEEFIEKNNVETSFLHRITVNYIRHNLTNYEEELDELFGQIGKDDGYYLLKNRILNKIKELYPFLQEECDRQMI